MDLEVIRRILIESKTTGVEQTTAQLKGLSAGYEGVTVASQKTETATESVARKFQALEARLDPAARAAQHLAKEITTLDQALAQGRTSAERHAELLSIATANAIKMGEGVTQASAAQKLWAEATTAANAQMQSMTAGTGSLGFALSSVGKVGFGIAVGLGAAVSAFRSFSDAAHNIADKSDELKRFADTTGFTTDQVQQLGKQAKTFGLAGEDIRSGLQRFAAGFEELREGGGTLLRSIQRVDAGLAEQMLTDESAAEALVHLQQALRQTDNIFEQSRIVRAALGRGGMGAIEFIKNADLSKLNADVAGIGYGLDKNIIEKTRKLGHEIEDVDKKIQHAFGADFAPMFLKLELAWKEYELSVLQGLGRIKKGFEGAFIPPDTAQSKFVAGREAGVPATLLNQQQKLNTLLQDQLDFAEKIRKEEGYDNPAAERAVAIAARLQEQLAKVDEQIRQIRGDSAEPIELKFELPKLDIKEIQKAVFGSVDIGSPRAGLIGPTLDVGSTGTIEGQTAAHKRLQEVLGALMPVQDQVINKMRELMIAEQSGIRITDEQSNAIRALARVQAEQAQVAPGTYQRQLEYLQQLKAAYPGLTAQQALAAQQLDLQLQAAQAVTGAEKMSAQYAADYAAAKGRGATAAEASAEATKKQAIAQAQANTAAQQQLDSLRDEYAVANAVTGAEKMRAQTAATTNQLLRQNVDAGLAEAVGAQQLANARAAANVAVEQQIRSLENQTELIQASVNGTTELVKQQQAYKAAIDSGASVEKAQQLVAAMQQQVQRTLPWRNGSTPWSRNTWLFSIRKLPPRMPSIKAHRC